MAENRQVDMTGEYTIICRPAPAGAVQVETRTALVGGCRVACRPRPVLLLEEAANGNFHSAVVGSAGHIFAAVDDVRLVPPWVE